MSITKQDLKHYRALCAMIERREERLRESAAHFVDTVQTSADFPYNKHTVKIEGDVYPPEAKAERLKIANMKAKKNEIECFVDNIRNWRVKTAMQQLYIDPCYGERETWESVADSINDGCTGNALKQYCFQYFKSIGLK